MRDMETIALAISASAATTIYLLDQLTPESVS